MVGPLLSFTAASLAGWSGPATTVQDHNGRPVISVDGEAHAPNWFVGSVGWGRSCAKGSANLSALNVQVGAAADVGFELVEVCLAQWQLNYSSSAPVRDQGIEAQTRHVIDTVLHASPRAKLILRILVEHVTAPITLMSWRNGSKLNVTGSPADHLSQGVSTVAGAWAAGAAARLVPFVAALDTAYPKRVAGVHLAAMHSGEWNWPGMCTWDKGGNDFAADYSEPTLAAFCRQRVQNGPPPACALPTAAERNAARTGNSFVCGSAHSDAASRVVEANRLLSRLTARAIAVLADALKHASAQRLLVLAFHGYTYTIADARLATFGHLQADTLIDHPSIDGYVSPYPYFATARSPEGAMYAGGQLDAPWLRRKLWLIEDDSRTSLAAPGPFRFCHTLKDTVNLLRRNIFTAALHANALYWFDLENKGWFGNSGQPEATKQVWAAISAAVKATSRLQLPPSQQRRQEPIGALPAPQIAVFFDTQAPITQLVDSGGAEQNMDGSLTYLKSPGGAWPLVNASQELAKIGAPVRHYYLSDLPRLDAAQIRLAIFPNAYAPTAAQRASIRDAFGGSNATLLFVGPAGLVNAIAAAADEEEEGSTAEEEEEEEGSTGAASGDQRRPKASGATCSTDEALVSELVGISALRPRAGDPTAAITTITSEAAAMGGRFAHVARELTGLTFGNPVPFAPLFYWAGKEEERGDVEVLGRYAGTNLPSLVASETARGYHAVYSGAPALPAALLRALAHSAGVHLYTSPGAHATTDAIDAIGNGLHVHAGPTAGDRRIALPMPMHVEGEDGSAVCATPCASFVARGMSAGESRLFYVTRPSAGTPPMPMPDHAETTTPSVPAAASAFLPTEDFPWLSGLATPAIVRELRAVSTGQPGFFREDWQGLTSPGASAQDWSALPLLNRGRLDEAGCALAPFTCTALDALLRRGQLGPRDGAREVGARLLRLAPDTSLRPHRGPGGRLVAHLGVVTPVGAALTVNGERRQWEEGKLIVFDDEAEHYAENRGVEARIVLHIAFPRDGRRSTSASPPVATIAASGGAFEVAVYANCTAQTTLLSDGRRSALLPLLTLYNRVDDNRPTDSDACVSVSKVGNETLRIVAAHGYGTVDVSWSVSAAWITLTLASLDNWHADPIEKHLQLARLETGLFDPTKAPFTSGRFQGARGLEGREKWSCGFFTLSSAWQQYNTFMYAHPRQKVAFACVKTAALSATWKALAAAEHLPPPNPNRALSWYWTNSLFTSEATIDTVIARAKALGCQLIFFLHLTSNRGDFVVDPKRFPSGFGVTAAKIRAAGLEVGVHIISAGAHIAGTAVVKERPEIFVPQGLTTRDYYYKTDSGTWWAHEAGGDWLYDHTRRVDSILPPSEQPPRPVPIRLYNGVTWSTLGRYRNGSAPMFDGKSSFGELIRTSSEHDFNASFSLQMVVHVVASPARAGNQTLAARRAAWRLLIAAGGRLEWHVRLASGQWAVARGTTNLLRTSGASRTRASGHASYVIKATFGSGKIRIHLCEIVDNQVSTSSGPFTLRNRCDMSEDGFASIPADASPARSVANITIGASLDAGRRVSEAFAGALEEIMLSKVDTTNWTKFNWNCPGTGMMQYYIFDYTNPLARAYWANATARLFNVTSASVSQWDGAEFQPSIAGWDIRHSSRTFNSGLYAIPGVSFHGLWGGGALQAFEQSRALWSRPLAVELSFAPPGLREAADMMPFSDEQRLAPSHGGKGMCVGGQAWVGGMLQRTVTSSMLYNGYNTPVSTLPNISYVDCFLGALVAAGVPPQMGDLLVYPPSTTPADVKRDARIRDWLQRAATFGHSGEASISWLHIGDGTGADGVFLVRLSSGKHAGLFVGASAHVTLPSSVTVAASTIVVFATTAVANHTAIFALGTPEDATARFFAAGEVRLQMDGGFWTLHKQDVNQTVFGPDGGAVSSRMLFGKPVSGEQHVVSPLLGVGSTVVYDKVSA